MGLPTCGQMHTKKPSVDNALQGWDVNLSQVYVNWTGPMYSCYGGLIYYRQL